MSDSAPAGGPGVPRSGPAETGTGGPRAAGSPAGTADRGRTTIETSVVEKLAGLAARQVPGVHAMGGGVARALGAVRDRVPGTGDGVTRGVSAEVGRSQAALDLEYVIEYGAPVTGTSERVRTAVVRAVERMTGLEVVEVNIAVGDVRLPGDEDDDNDERDRPRLR